jgi:type IV pilus assembly protein PilW
MFAHDFFLRRQIGRTPIRQKKQQGFTLVELMVSLVISLLISLAALGSARMFMGIQRQSVGTGVASGNAVTTMAAIKHEAEQAALGFYIHGTLPCQAINLSVGKKTIAANAPLSPVNISNSSGNFAQLDVLYASDLEAVTPAYLATGTTSDATSASLSSYLPIQVGQTVMFTPLGDAGQPCTVKTATEVDAALPGTGPVLHFDPSGQHNQVTFPTASYSTDSAVSLVGALRWSYFAVDANGKLVMTRPIEGDSAVFARNVVGFQVQYGVTNGVSSSLESWEFAQGETWANLTTALLPRVRALRLGMVIRSDQPEKPDAQGHCSATSEMPTLLEQPMGLTGNWQCYRYRSSTAIIPMRNLLMGSNT